MTRRTFGMAAVAVMAGFPKLWAQATPTAKELVHTMIENERVAELHRPFYSYLSVEKSARTNGHFWTEHVVETSRGRVRFLVAEDEKPLGPERVAQERGRLAAILKNPAEFEAKEKAQKDDEGHAKQMLELLGKAYLLENLRVEGTDWKMDFRPDPGYSPNGIEEKVLHGMSGSLLIDQQQIRLHHVEGRIAQDVGIGFGLLATVHAGSHFLTTKAPFEGQWRTVRVVSDMQGKVAMFKSMAKDQDVTRSLFHRVDDSLDLAAAVAMAEEPAA